jgi:hypothetical protein
MTTPETHAGQAVRSSPLFGIGQYVSWCHFVASSGGRMHFTTRRGRIYAISGPMAYVTLGNGHKTHVLLTSLDTPGEKTELTKLAEGLGQPNTTLTET